MATLTLGQMLDAALGAPKTESIDFEQLRNLLNGMLLHLGLRDLAVQESGEPLEGAERSPFSASFLEELMQKVEANEKEIAEVETLPSPGCFSQAVPSSGICTPSCCWGAAAEDVLKAKPCPDHALHSPWLCADHGGCKGPGPQGPCPGAHPTIPLS